MKKQKSVISQYFVPKKAGFSLLSFVVLCAVLILSPLAQASIQDEINQLEAENKVYEKKVLALEDRAVGYRDALDQLRAEVGNIQAKITENEKKQAQLKEEIIAAEKELEIQKDLLSQNIRAIYIEGDITTLEMLATSDDLSDFLDKQEYRNVIQNKIKTTLDKINELKKRLTRQKKAVELLLAEQKEEQAKLVAARDEQARLLDYNQQQQAEFNDKTEANQARIAELIEQQRRANFNPDGGYYFLRFEGSAGDFDPNDYKFSASRGYGFSMQTGPCSNDDSWPDSPDDWGYCTRQCVSYAAWAVGASGRDIPYYYGNAAQWVAAAYAKGVPVYRTPEPGDIAISTSGYWGHAMYVESVSGNTFTTSEYNTYLTGELSYQTRSY